MSIERKEIAEEVWHSIPSDEKLKSMSFSELAIEIEGCKKDSPKFLVIEREMRRHLAKDQAKVNLPNILVGACIGLVGVVLGAYLKDSPPLQQVAPAAAVQEMKKGDLAVKPPVVSPAPAQPSTVNPTKSPEPAQSNAQPRQPHP